jgi:beta-hydroxylase
VNWPSILAYLVEPPRLLVYGLIASTVLVQLRGREKLRFARTMGDLGTYAWPYNALVYLTSRTPNRPYLPEWDFPEMQVIKDNWRVLRDEALKLRSEGAVHGSIGDQDIAFSSFYRRGWKSFYIKWYGHPLPSAERLCPRSAALLNQVPSIRGALFANLPAGGSLGRHRDPFAGFVRYQLGLETPNSDACWISVDGEKRSWRDGEVLIFDETYVHEVLNDTDKDRLILFCDVERPVAAPMRPINRAFLSLVMGSSGTQNEPGEKIGTLNTVYGVVSGAHKWLKQLKARHRRVYYAQKWVTLGLLGAVFLAPY